MIAPMMKWYALLLSAVLPAAAALSASGSEFEIIHDDDSSFSASIEAMDMTQITLTTKSETKTYPLSGIVKLRNLARNPYDKEPQVLKISPRPQRRVSQPNNKAVNPELAELIEAGNRRNTPPQRDKAGTLPESFTVAELKDGSQFAVSSFSIAKNTADCRLIGQENSISVPLDKIASVRLSVRGLSEILQPAEDWLRIVKTGVKGDRIVTGSPGKFDVYDGILEGITGETISFAVDGETLRIPNRKVYGIVLHGGKPAAAVRSPAVLSLWAGTRVSAAEVQVKEEEVICKTPDGVQFSVPVDAVLEITFGEKKMVPLADLEFVCKEHSVPIVQQGGLLLSKTIEKFNILRSGNLQHRCLIDGTSYDSGMTLTGKTTLEFRIPKPFAALKGVIGVEDQFRPFTAADVQISADGQILGTWQIRGDKPLERFQLNLPPNCRSLFITAAPPAGSELPAVVTFGNLKLYE
ncbi:MAG: hypothetical protein LBH00_06935 [Planctomycetaceae bacterium]|nr:hypothetical protein [Planctomycetaceae bacterium]